MTMSAVVGPVRHERDERGQRAADDRTDDGDEGAEEDQDGQRQGQRHAEQGEPHADEDGVDEADGGLRLDEARQRHPRPLRHGRDVRRRPRADQTAQPRQELRPVLEVEEAQDEREQRRHQRRAGGGSPAEHPRRDALGVGLQLTDHVLDRVADLLLAQVQRRSGDALLQLARPAVTWSASSCA
jgi:hypothetical protein